MKKYEVRYQNYDTNYMFSVKYHAYLLSAENETEAMKIFKKNVYFKEIIAIVEVSLWENRFIGYIPKRKTTAK